MPDRIPAPPPHVAEIQGLYGPFSFPEKLLQKLWLRREFDLTRAETTAGERVEVLHPGKWNLLGGPDFKGAHLRLAGRALDGDVELHLKAGDWAAHRHAQDPAYDGVVLHVVLFPPGDVIARTREGRAIPTVALLPLLPHDLEEYAAEDAVEALANRPAHRAVEALGALAPESCGALLRDHARMRWRTKVHFAAQRLARLGWTAACHHAALEILGYRFNRAPMLRTAARAPLEAWERGDAGVEELAEAERGRWSVQGVRPANHPRVRLGQYAAWVRARSGWPAVLAALAGTLPAGLPEERPTGEIRREQRLAVLRGRLADELLARTVGGARLDNLICDGFLPLLAARAGGDWFGLWFHWLAGDVPAALPRALRELGIFAGRARPANHGYAQGLMSWTFEQENAVVRGV